MTRKISATALGAVLLFIAACTSSTFVASKDGKSYYLGNSSQAAFELFCQSGDLGRILAQTETIDQETRDDLYQYNCGPDRSTAKVKQLFASMTRAQRKELRQSFKNNGYDINIMQC